MADKPSEEQKTQTSEPPAPEVLQPRSVNPDDPVKEDEKPGGKSESKTPRFPRTRYRVSHRATFLGLGVVVAVLVINAAIIAFVIKRQNDQSSKSNQAEVVVSQEALEKLGVNRDTVGELGVELIVNPNARFNNKVVVGGDVSIGGALKLNNSFSAGNTSLADLQAGNTSLEQLNVNGSSTFSNVSLRNDLTVAGTSRFQGPVVLSQLVTAENNLNVSGSLTVGKSFSANNIHTASLTVDSAITIGGHIITKGSAPSVSAGSAVGSNGTVSISGNDASGTVAVNVGVGAASGTLVTITFKNKYDNTPHVAVTAVGRSAGSFYINRSSTNFSIVVPVGLTAGAYAFDYMVMQ